MNVDFREAARRLSVIGNWMLVAGGSIAALIVLFSAVLAFQARSLNFIAPNFMEGVMVLLPGIGVRLTAWVVDGLAGPSEFEDAETRALARSSK